MQSSTSALSAANSISPGAFPHQGIQVWLERILLSLFGGDCDDEQGAILDSVSPS